VREFVTLAGTIDRIDRPTRSITVRVDPRTTQVVYVPPEIKQFDDLKTGDKVTARIRESVIVSTRPGLKPQVVADTTAQAAKASDAGADTQMLQQLTMVVTLENIDPQAQLVTYKTADNRRVIRAVADPHLLEGLKAGDIIEVTLTRQRVVELQRQ
jgi:Cu/Ag efflux protein CusF